jgi:transcriptional regulator
MYQPAHFREDRLEVQHALIRAHPLGLIISNGASGLAANPIPFVVQPPSAAAPHGTLQCHLARANEQWKDFAAASECLVVFQGVDTYVTPSWYETKRETGKVVPTWNYATVHAWGRARVMDDAAWLGEQIRALTEQHERPRAEPWAVTDAPAPYIDVMIRGIVGVEIVIERMEGKWKVSQNQPDANRRGVEAGLTTDGQTSMAELVRRHGGAA